MANKKISELDSRASLSLSDLLAVGDPTTGYLYKITITDLKSLTGAGVISFNGRVGSVAPAEGDYTLNQLGDVIITSATNGNILQYNGSNWVNVAAADLSGFVPYTGATSNVNLGTYDLSTDIVNANDIKALTSGGLDIYSNSGTHIALMGGGGGAGTTFYGGLIGTTGSFSSSGGSNTFSIDHSSGSGIALSITKGGNGEGIYVNKTSGSGNAATIVGTLEATTLVKTGGTSSQFLKADGSVDSSTYLTTSSASSTYVPLTRTLTINGTAFDLSADRTWTIPTHDAVTIGTANGLSLSGQALSLALASTSATGALSSTDWNTFNGKQNALTNPVTGTGTSGHVTYFTGSTSVAGSANHFWDATNNRLGIGTTNPQRSLEIFNATADAHLRLSGAAPTVSMGEAVTGSVYQAKFGLVTANAQFVTGSLAGDFVIISQTGATIWVTSGGEKMRLTSGGNVGIGTTSPGANLDVVSSIRATNNTTTGLNSSNIQLAAHNGTSVVVSGSMFQTNSTFSYQQISPNQTNIYGTAANGMRIATANAPIIFATGNSDADFSTARLTIASTGAATFSSSLTIEGSGSTIRSGNELRFNRADNAIYTRMYDAGSGAANGFILDNTNGEGFHFKNGATTIMRMPSNGNVGIGTSSPNSVLEVYGQTRISASLGSVLLITPDATSTNGVTLDTSYYGTAGYGPMKINVGGSERMRITSDGYILAGTTSNSFTSRLVLHNPDSYALHCVRTGTGSEGQVVFSNANGAVGSIFTSGSGTSYNTSSDYRLKADFKDFSGLDLVSKMKAYDHEWKTDKSRSHGVIAHELQTVINYAVTGEKDGKQMQGVDYSKIVPVLIKAIQELNDKIK
jgi:hypothetical protein